MSTESEMTPDGEAKKNFVIKVFGVGGAGGNLVDYMTRQDFAGVEFMAANCDRQALARARAPAKWLLGEAVTRGLGAGGDPEVGRAAAETDAARLRTLCEGADIVFIAAGLGGGTGTGGAPVLARVARETGALVLGIVTLPFEFEGGRRQRQAQLGLQQLKAEADGVICLPNQKVLKLVDANTSVVEAFNVTNELLAQGVRGVWRLLASPGLIHVDFADLCAVTRGRHAESSLATVEAAGEHRARETWEKLLAHPLLDDGQALAEADAILVSLIGGPDLAMDEMYRLMEQIQRQSENAHIIMGASIEETFSGRLGVTLLVSRNGRPGETGQSSSPDLPKEQALPGAEYRRELTPDLLDPSATERPAPRFVPPPPAVTPEKAEEILKQQTTSARRGGKRLPKMKQGQLPLEIISKGRFEKSQPTLHNGEDLDTPTYLRRGVALN